MENVDDKRREIMKMKDVLIWIVDLERELDRCNVDRLRFLIERTPSPRESDPDVVEVVDILLKRALSVISSKIQE